MTRSPAFQFYPHDFLAGRVATYSLEEIGAYMLLLSFDWTLTGLPTRQDELARLLRISQRKFAPLWARLADQFVERDGRMFNPRLELERKKQRDYSAAMSENGKAGGRPRKSRGLADGKPIESSPSPSPSPSNNRTTTDGTDAPDEEFEAAWAIYPRRAGGNSKSDALRAWKAKRRAGVDPAEMIAGLRRYANYVMATGKVGTEYVKQASSFFGRGEHYKQEWAIPNAPPAVALPRMSAGEQQLANILGGR